jgi:hypothetical protein
MTETNAQNWATIDNNTRNGADIDRNAQLLTGSIDDYLLGLADGIQKAQRQLSQMALTLQPGETAVSYQIPRVEFELKMSLEVVAESNDAGVNTTQLRFRPATPTRTGATTTDVSSIIRGAFVAVPVHGGKPPPDIRTTLRRINARRFEVTVHVASAAGELLAGVEIQFNVDRERSQALTVAPGGSSLPPGIYDDKAAAYDYVRFGTSSGLNPGTGFWDGSVLTDAAGIAVGVLEIDAQEPRNTRVAAVIDVLGQTETIVFQVE